MWRAKRSVWIIHSWMVWGQLPSATVSLSLATCPSTSCWTHSQCSHFYFMWVESGIGPKSCYTSILWSNCSLSQRSSVYGLIQTENIFALHCSILFLSVFCLWKRWCVSLSLLANISPIAAQLNWERVIDSIEHFVIRVTYRTEETEGKTDETSEHAAGETVLISDV